MTLQGHIFNFNHQKLICFKKSLKNPQLSCPFSNLPMFKSKFLCLCQCKTLKIIVVWKALDVSFSVVQVLSLVNIERKWRKSMFSQSLCLPSKDQEIFFFVYFHIFWPEICMCRVLDQTLDVRDIDPLLKKLFWLLRKCCLKLGAQFLHL